MMRTRIITLMCLAFLATTGRLHAAPIIEFFGATTLVTGIQDLDIDGTLYDVVFVEGKYSDVYPSPVLPTFFGDSAGAISAANAISDTLTGTTATFFYRTVAVSAFLHVPFSLPDDTCCGVVGDPGVFPSVDPDGNHLFSLDWGQPNSTQVFLWPNFTLVSPTQVPEPSSLLLFGLSLGVSGLVVRQKRSARSV
jgi:hypothetical protein